MNLMFLAIAALAAIVPASSFAASLSKVGGVFQSQRLPDDLSRRCELADGTSLVLERTPLYDSPADIYLHHLDANGEGVQAPVLIASGHGHGGTIACAPDGGALVDWVTLQPLRTHYRLVGSDHQTLSAPRLAPARSEEMISFRFAMGADGYAIAWKEPYRRPSNIYVQGFNLDGTAQFDPLALSLQPTLAKEDPARSRRSRRQHARGLERDGLEGEPTSRGRNR